MKALIEYLVTSLVDNPNEVQIEECELENEVKYTIRVSQADLGKVIGKRGRTAKAMRALVKVFSEENPKEIKLDIADPLPAAEPKKQDA